MVMFFMIMAGRLGGKVQAAYTIGLRLEMLAIMLAFPIANACATLVGQNLGARNLARAWSAIWASSAVELAALWPLALARVRLPAPARRAVRRRPGGRATGGASISSTRSSILAFYGLYFVAFRTLQASGDMNSPMIISVSTAVFVGAPLGYWLATRTDLGATGMWIANLVYALLERRPDDRLAACVASGPRGTRSEPRLRWRSRWRSPPTPPRRTVPSVKSLLRATQTQASVSLVTQVVRLPMAATDDQGDARDRGDGAPRRRRRSMPIRRSS